MRSQPWLVFSTRLTCLDVNMAGILNQAICDSGFTAEQKAELGTDVATCMVDSV